jgi:sigma-B regulation protein RsbU (phosphoserine phosphatase)
MDPQRQLPARGAAASPLLAVLSMPPPEATDSVRNLVFRSRLGRVFLAALAIRLGIAPLHARLPAAAWLDVATILAGLTLAATTLMLVWRLWGIARRRLLWRVRRKLILSYVFIGFVPVVLLVAFFLFAGLLMSLHVSAFLFKRGFDDLVDDATVLAQTTAIEIQRGGLAQAGEVIARKVVNAEGRYPGVSIALVPRRDAAQPLAGPGHNGGPWAHAEPPRDVPSWVSAGGFGGLLALAYAEAPPASQVVVRAVAFPEQRDPPFGVVVDIPLDERVQAWLRESTGITLAAVSVLNNAESARPAPARAREPAPAAASGAEAATGPWAFNSLTFFDYVDWETGRTGTVSLGIRVSIGEIYDRLLAAQSRLGRFTLGELFLIVLSVIAVLFLIIEIAALTMGAALARSITGAIHQLFDGTQRVRAGDFSHRIDLRSRDQLGELADSFNQMTTSINVLLRQAEEKRRLEEELRIAREIQMSLLPRGPFVLPGVQVSALCMPAREVGGDYYDYFPLGDRRVGMLIADVAGKGTSAALYMAELKGLMLSLSMIHESPKALLVQANHVLAAHLDSRSFITMTYAIVDLQRRTLTYARAGHTPLMHYHDTGGGRREVAVLAPDGIVVGLGIDGAAARFAQLLQEQTIPLVAGDVFVLFTDGISEAMNPVADLFGEDRLQELIAEHGHLPTEEIRERIVQEVEAFASGADQHDDMTMILLKVDASAPHVGADDQRAPARS